MIPFGIVARVYKFLRDNLKTAVFTALFFDITIYLPNPKTDYIEAFYGTIFPKNFVLQNSLDNFKRSINKWFSASDSRKANIQTSKKKFYMLCISLFFSIVLIYLPCNKYSFPRSFFQ